MDSLRSSWSRMALAAVSRSSNMRLRGAEVWLTRAPVFASILSMAPQSGQATSKICSFGLAMSISNCMPRRGGLPSGTLGGAEPSQANPEKPHSNFTRWGARTRFLRAFQVSDPQFVADFGMPNHTRFVRDCLVSAQSLPTICENADRRRLHKTPGRSRSCGSGSGTGTVNSGLFPADQVDCPTQNPGRLRRIVPEDDRFARHQCGHLPLGWLQTAEQPRDDSAYRPSRTARLTVGSA